MIWNPETQNREADSTLVSHIAAQIDEVCAGSLSSGPDQIRELARAIESFLREQVGSSPVDSRYLTVLAARALSSLGEGRAARRLLLFGTGMVVPSEWEVTRGEAMWVLDLRQMTVRDGASLEMVFFTSLTVILDTMADVWDASGGAGTLGLRHISAAARALGGGSDKAKQTAILATEIKDVCRRKLEQISRDRRWSEVPQVMDLDL